MTRKLLALAVPLAVLALVFAACGDDDEEVSDGDAFATNTVAATTAAAAQVTDSPTQTDCPDPSGDAPEATVKTYDSAPPMTITPTKAYTATIKTVRGDIIVRLRPDLAPQHVNSFVFLARDGFYDGVTFHRVLPGFVAQAGDPGGDGTGGPGYNIPLEATTEVKFVRGTLGMARANTPDSAGSQWFINYAATPSLDGLYTIFGEVTEGMDVVDCITPRDPSRSASLPPGDKIITIEITES